MFLLDHPDPLALCGILLLSPLLFLCFYPSQSGLPLINPKKKLEISDKTSKIQFVTNARGLIEAGLQKSNIFRLLSDNGCRIILSPKYANEIRSHPALSFGKAVAKEFHTYIPGFEPFKQTSSSENIFQDAVRMKLTQALGQVTKPLTEEMTVALESNWSDNSDWHTIPLKTSVLKIVARLSSKVFLGDKICRNPDWLRITVDYTVDSFRAAEILRMWPRVLRPVVAWFSEDCRRLRSELQEARDIIAPVLEERRVEKEAALRDGRKPQRHVDAMEWMEESAKGRPYDPAVGQLMFSVAAIHTTSDMLTQALYDLCGREQLIQEMREEVISVISAEGWKKTALYKLQLMDSMLKESQRLKPINITSMRRLAIDNIRLNDGTKIPKNSYLLVANERMWNPKFYQNPDTFDAYRFLNLRKVSGHETSAQLVAPSPEHMGFGLGKHACPGRFFAANEAKIALCHILLKYDLKAADGPAPQIRKYGLSVNADPLAKVMIRRRKEEIVLEEIAA